MAELSTDPAATTATTASCCSAETQATCCEPSGKAACCAESAAGGSCGCSAGQTTEAPAAQEIREPYASGMPSQPAPPQAAGPAPAVAR
jgi:hypothetical protein